MTTPFSQFQHDFTRLLAGEVADIYQTIIPGGFESIASVLFKLRRDPGTWYDGVANLEYQRRKTHQIDFTGMMWVAKGRQWQEFFAARVTDKTQTQQGLWINMRIGDFAAEGDVQSLIE